MDPVAALGAGVAGAIGKRIANRLLGNRGAGGADAKPVDQQQFDKLLKMAANSQAASGTTPSAAKAGDGESSDETTSTSATTGSSGTGNAITNAVESDLGKDAFLQLLVTQMQYQDPLNPVDNTEMIAQLAQFSSLEQMQNLNTGFNTLSGNIDQLNFLSASNMLGKEVSGITTDGTLVEGTVERVQLNGSLVYLTVDGELLSMAGVLSIADQPA